MRKDIEQQIAETDKYQSLMRRDRIGKVRDFGEMKSYLPQIPARDCGYVESYFKLQKRIADRQLKKAKRHSDLLNIMTGFADFEKKNEPILAAIEYAVTGISRREDVVPALKMAEHE